MKDYLNSNEKDQSITFLKAIDHAAIIEQEWGERGNLTKEELKALRNVITWSRKVATSIVDRQNISAKRTIAKTLQSSYLILILQNLHFPICYSFFIPPVFLFNW